MTVEDLIEKVVRLRIFYDRNLHTESIRGNVIIVSSVVHALLSDLIKDEVLMRSLKLGKEAYGDFYEAINNSLSLGIVGKSTAKGLHLLRKLRNDLAHGVELMGDNHKVSERIGEISRC